MTVTKDMNTDMSLFISHLEMALNKSKLVEVKFTKVDGTVRTMLATRHAELVPAKVVVEGVEQKERKPNDAILSVYDVEVKNWRSFRKENVLEFTVKE